MNSSWIVDGVIVMIIALMLFLAWRSIARNGTCSSDCSGCMAHCSSRKKAKAGDVPPFVQAYRHDHPKVS